MPLRSNLSARLLSFKSSFARETGILALSPRRRGSVLDSREGKRPSTFASCVCSIASVFLRRSKYICVDLIRAKRYRVSPLCYCFRPILHAEIFTTRHCDTIISTVANRNIFESLRACNCNFLTKGTNLYRSNAVCIQFIVWIHFHTLGNTLTCLRWYWFFTICLYLYLRYRAIPIISFRIDFKFQNKNSRKFSIPIGKVLTISYGQISNKTRVIVRNVRVTRNDQVGQYYIHTLHLHKNPRSNNDEESFII